MQSQYNCVLYIGLWHVRWRGIFFIANLYRRAQHSMGTTIPRQVGMSWVRKLPQCEAGEEQIRGIPLQSQLLDSCLSPFLDSLQKWTVTWTVKPSKPCPPQDSSVTVLVTAWNTIKPPALHIRSSIAGAVRFKVSLVQKTHTTVEV